MPGLTVAAADRLGEERDLAAHAEWRVDAVQLRGVGEARGDQHAVAHPAEQLRGTRVLIAREVADQTGGERRHAVCDDVGWNSGVWRRAAAGRSINGRAAGGENTRDA